MAILLPPYSKIHIIVFGSLALFAGFIFLFILNNQSQTNNTDAKSTIVSVTAKELQEDPELKDSLKESQQKVADVTWLSKNFVILDIRPESEFNAQHISGSVNAPLEYLAAASLVTDVHMVVYSNNQEDLTKASSILEDKGIKNIYLLNESLDQLKTKGFTLKATEVAEGQQ